MSLDLQLTGLLHPGQVLTVSQAAARVQQLIEHFTEHVTTLPVCTLERHEIPQYVAVLERLLEHAGVLEQLLCRISFSLPGHVVEYVVAIIVATHYQLSHLDAQDTHSVLDRRTIAWMSSYLHDVLSYLNPTDDWVHTDEYARVRRGVDNSIAEMRNSLDTFVAWYRDTAGDRGATWSTSHSFPNTPESPDTQDHLTSFLTSLYPGVLRTPSLPDADWMVLKSNFRPIILSDVLPYTRPDFYMCWSSSSSSAGSSTACSGSPRMSLKGKERALPVSTGSPSPTASDWSTSAESGSPRRLPSVTSMSASPEPADSQEAGPSTRKRIRTEPEDPPSPPKKRRVSLEVYGVCGGLPGTDTHTAAVERVHPFVGRTVPLVEDLSPFTLPSRCSSPSPAPTEGSMSCFASPILPPCLFPPSAESKSSPDSSTFEISAEDEDEERYYSSGSSTTSTDDTETTCDTSSYATAWEVSLADGPGGHPVITQVNPSASRTPEAPERTRTTRRKRRCFAGLMQAVKHIFALR
ncbi:hypothetical protein OH76DRAFT_1485423 [Lentinus brumalis]|uniref:Uncharacterized protein n=1 Tax=Lentinus brumalis TaxID=2498619 RepID=A0A371D1X3_9APHY|nr:hypothetical protein OH76DRAFT_1485423 [Polyporus brumalis]